MFKTLNNKVLVQIKEAKSENSFGLIVERKTDVETAVILACNPNDPDIQVSDTILISKVNMASTHYGHLIDKKDILAIVD